MSEREDELQPGWVDAGTEDGHHAYDCTCPVVDQTEQGEPVYDLDEDCPVHG